MSLDTLLVKNSRASDSRVRQCLARRDETQRLAASRLIRQLLTVFLDQTPRATQISLDVRDPDAPEKIRDFVPYCVVKRPAPGKLLAATHLTLVDPDHETALPPRQGGHCVLPHAAAKQPDRSRHRQARGGANLVVVCPASDRPGTLTGSIIVLFDPRERAPQGMELRRLKRDGARLGSQITAVLDLVGQSLVLPSDTGGAIAGVSSFRQ